MDLFEDVVFPFLCFAPRRFFLFQVMGKVPTISINKTEGCHVYLSEDALDCEIMSAKSSEMNILVPQDGDYVSPF